MTRAEYYSTRDSTHRRTASEAIAAGLAPDGGLYVPVEYPRFSVADFADKVTAAGVAEALLQPFFAGDALETELSAICREAFSFPLPRVALPATDTVSVLELFHGPTAAFKDVGARFLAACMQRHSDEDQRPLSVLVATSGDTGGAVAAAFHKRPGMRVDVFYPRGQVSARQEHQLTCWSDNVRAFRVDGPFDACQDLVKTAFQDAALNQRARLTSANSINLGRLLPQMVYYALTALEIYRESGNAPSFIVPTGNLGNALACVWARRTGLPIGDIVLATNRNRTIADFFSTGMWQPRASVASLASAMDVGNPSNMERLRDLYAHDNLAAEFYAHSVGDDEIRAQIRADFERYGQIWCPHTATAFRVYDELPAERRTGVHWVGVATAHPAKFEEIVEPLIGQPVPVPQALTEIFALPTRQTDIAADLDVLRDYY